MNDYGADPADLAALAAPFEPDQIRWRVLGKVFEKANKPASCRAVAYIDARDVMNRLDSVLTPCGWQNELEQGPTGTVFCGLSVLVCIKGVGVWITKSDGAGLTDIESEKGAISGALKRAAVLWGIGRYLYDLGTTWVDVEKRGKGFEIKANQRPRLAKIVAALGAGDAPEDSPPTGGPDAEKRLDSMISWCGDHEVTIEMVWQFLERIGEPRWGSIAPEQLDAIAAQAKLVVDGLAPTEAFGRSEEGKTVELTERLDGAGPAS